MDSAYQKFFERPDQTCHRQYEALRAVFVDQRPQQEVADQFGFTYGALRQLARQFRQFFDAPNQHTASFFFETIAAGWARLRMPTTA